MTNKVEEAVAEPQPQARSWQVVLGFLLLLVLLLAAVGLVFGLFYAVYRLGVGFFSLETEIARAIIAATGIASAAILANIVGNGLAARAQRHQDIRERKREVYVRLLEVLFKTFKIIDIEDEAKQVKMQADIVSEMRDMTPTFMLWSSRPVIKAWRDWLQQARKWEGGASPGQAVGFLIGLSDLVNQIRSEFGLRKLRPGESLGVFITDIDEYVAQK